MPLLRAVVAVEADAFEVLVVKDFDRGAIEGGTNRPDEVWCACRRGNKEEDRGKDKQESRLEPDRSRTKSPSYFPYFLQHSHYTGFLRPIAFLWPHPIQGIRCCSPYRVAMTALSVVAAVSGRPQGEDVLDSGRKMGRPQDHAQAHTPKQTMDPLGLMAAGIAQDFTNLLTLMRAYNELLKHTATVSEDQCTAINTIAQASGRASSLTAQLLALSRRELVQPVAVDLNLVVTDLDQILRRLLGENNIWLSTTLAPSLGLVRADPTQLEQVLLILVVHARDAMSRGGELTIETANSELDDTYVRHHPGARPGSYVKLAVRETGMGIDGAIRAHRGEPCFTRKGEGQGTGLGLSIIYGIVKQSGGYITVDSEPGHGMTSTVYLPRIGDVGQSPTTGQEVLMTPH